MGALFNSVVSVFGRLGGFFEVFEIGFIIIEVGSKILGIDHEQAPKPPDKAAADEPPPPPTAPALHVLNGVVSDGAGAEALSDSEQARRLWLTLQHELYRQRGEGFRVDWAFPIYASRYNLGAPLLMGSRISVDGVQHAIQPFARSTLFNEIPYWSNIRDMNNYLGGTIPEGGFARRLLRATYQLSGSPLHADWPFHQIAVREQLGPPLQDHTRIRLGKQEYNVQVFACDTLYNLVPDSANVRRLSATEPGELADALWKLTYAATGATFDPTAPAHQFAVQEKIGTPLSSVYQIDFDGTVFDIQVFALDVIFARHGQAAGEVVFARQSSLPRPEKFTYMTPLSAGEAAPAIYPLDVNSPEQALSGRQPYFAMLPVAGQPRIAQLYGYTRWAVGDGKKFYESTQGFHPGIDFAVPVGTPLLAIEYGLVVYAGPAKDAPFSGAPEHTVIVRYGSVYAIYGHCSAVQVKAAELINPGQTIALSGEFGGQPHLHFEVRPVPTHLLNNVELKQPASNPGFAVNPLYYFNDEMTAYFEYSFAQLGGEGHFCRGGLTGQEKIIFGGPVATEPCVGDATAETAAPDTPAG